MTANREALNFAAFATAPVFADADHNADIIGHARTAPEALALYASYFAGTGAKAVKAFKATPERSGEGTVDGWVPELADE